VKKKTVSKMVKLLFSKGELGDQHAEPDHTPNGSVSLAGVRRKGETDGGQRKSSGNKL